MSVFGMGLALHHELPMYRRCGNDAMQPLGRSPFTRLCIPEQHGIREVIYTTMKSHALKMKEILSVSPPESSDSHIDTNHSNMRLADELRKLIEMFDNVLLEGYCGDHDSLFLRDFGSHKPTCHYCGAFLFLSYFNCAGLCFDLTTDTSRVDSSIRVCGACYVEGRFCACRKMSPKRLQSFSGMLQERNEVAKTLSIYYASNEIQTDDLGEVSER